MYELLVQCASEYLCRLSIWYYFMDFTVIILSLMILGMAYFLVRNLSSHKSEGYESPDPGHKYQYSMIPLGLIPSPSSHSLTRSSCLVYKHLVRVTCLLPAVQDMAEQLIPNGSYLIYSASANSGLRANVPVVTSERQSEKFIVVARNENGTIPRKQKVHPRSYLNSTRKTSNLQTDSDKGYFGRPRLSLHFQDSRTGNENMGVQP